MSSPIGYPQGNAYPMFSSTSVGDVPVAVGKEKKPLYVSTSSSGEVRVSADVLTIPAEFSDFDFAKLGSPITIYRDATGATAWDYDYTALIPAACKSAPLSRCIHISPTGSDSNTGVGAYIGDFSNAKATLGSVKNAVNALAAGCQVIVAPGTYLRSASWNSAIFTADIWVRGWINGDANKKPRLLMADDVVWAQDATYTTLYKSARTAVFKSINLLSRNIDGDYEQFTKYSTLAAANSAAGSAWYYDGTTIYLKRADGLAPTIRNTAALMNAKSFTMSEMSGHVYMSDIEITGGIVEALLAATKNVTFVDVDLLNAGGSASIINAISILGIDQFVGIRCRGVGASNDGFNVHWDGTKRPQAAFLSCVGANNGDGNTSCNGVTAHDGCSVLVVGGTYRNNRGANVIPINTGSQMLVIGARADSPYNSGATPPQNDTASDNSLLVLIDTVGSNSDGDITAALNSRVLVRRHKSVGCRVQRSVNDTATITDF